MSVQAHCLLCVQPIQDKNPVIVFLDIDDVLITRHAEGTKEKIEATIIELFSEKHKRKEKFTELEWRIAAAHHFSESSLKNLKILLDRIEKTRSVHIVLSSQWRNDGTLDQIRNQMFSEHFFSKKIIGKTPPQNREDWTPEIKEGHTFETIAKEKYNLTLHNRAEQIEFWLRDHKLENADFVILDDCDAGLSEKFRERFVCVRSLLSNEEVNIALKILKIIDPNPEVSESSKLTKIAIERLTEDLNQPKEQNCFWHKRKITVVKSGSTNKEN